MSGSTFQLNDKVFHAFRKNGSNQFVPGKIVDIVGRQYMIKFEDNEEYERCSTNKFFFKQAAEKATTGNIAARSGKFKAATPVQLKTTVPSRNKSVNVLSNNKAAEQSPGNNVEVVSSSNDLVVVSSNDLVVVSSNNKAAEQSRDNDVEVVVSSNDLVVVSSNNKAAEQSSVVVSPSGVQNVILIAGDIRILLVEYTATFEYITFSTDCKFSMPIETPKTDFFVKTEAKFYSAVIHASVRDSIFAGDLLYFDEDLLKTFIGIFCSPKGDKAVAVITSFELVLTPDSTCISAFKTEYLTIDELVNEMKTVQDFIGIYARHMLTGELVDQMYLFINKFVEELSDVPDLVAMLQKSTSVEITNTIKIVAPKTKTNCKR